MLYRTEVYNRAALFMTIGGKLLKIEGKYPHNIFDVEVTWWQILYEKACGWVPYKRYINQRNKLKKKARLQAGLPEHYLGDGKGGFTFADLVMFKKNDR